MSLANQPVVEVHDLVKRYRKAKVNAVDGISLSVEVGEFFAVLGPNGAGKTTTISILTTTLAPTSGTVRICGHDLRREAAAVIGVGPVAISLTGNDDMADRALPGFERALKKEHVAG